MEIRFPLSLTRPSCRNASLRSLQRFWSYPLFTLYLLASPEDQRLNALCPVRALQAYMTRTSAFRKSSLFQGLPPHKGESHFKAVPLTLACGRYTMAYEAKGVQPLGGIRAHSTRGLAPSWALFRGVPLQDICSAASWASPHTFERYYRLDVTRTSVAHSVLGVGSP